MAEIFIFTLKCFYLMLPAYFANMAPVIFKRINIFVCPIDFNKKLLGKPILGKNKTYRGLFFSVISSVIIALIQHYLYNFDYFRTISFFNYQRWFLFGLLMGFGAVFGDIAKSFLKRMAGIKSGNPFIPFDQIDFAIGSLLLIYMFKIITLRIILVSVVLSFVLHIIVNHIAYYAKIREEMW